MGLLIDSDVWIENERGRFPLSEFLSDRDDEPVSIAAITASELLTGTHRGTSPTSREKRRTGVETFLQSVTVVSFDLPIARLHAALWAETEGRGIKIASHDLIIAATALSLDYSLVSFNARDFRVFPQLKLIVPDT